MFSKWRLWLASVLLLTACARENEPASAPIEVSLKGGSECLSAFGERMSDYVQERLSSDQLAQFWDCTARAVGDYQRLSEEESTAQAIRHFVQRYFIKNRTVSDSFLHSLMQLKRVVVGGRDQEITRAELDRLKGFIAELKEVTLDLQPLAGVVFLQRAAASDAEARAATTRVQRAGLRLGRWFQHNGQDYAFVHMQQLVRDLRAFANPADGDGAKIYDDLDRALQILPRVKHILLAGSETAIAGGEWAGAWAAIVRGYGAFLNLHYTFKGDLNSGLIRRGGPQALDELRVLLEAAVAAREGHVIGGEEWRDLFVRLAQTGWLDKEFTGSHMNDLWQWMVRRLLKGSADGALGAGQIAVLRRHSAIWQALLDHVDGNQTGPDPELTRFLEVRDASAPLEWDEEGRLLYPRQGASEWTSERERRMVWPFVVINFLRESYAGEELTFDQEQMTTAVHEILPLAKNLGFLLDTKMTVGTRLLRETDLFTLASNGDGILTMPEAVRELVFAASSLRYSQIWLAKADQLCGSREAACVRPLALAEGSTLLDTMPRLKSRFQSLPKGEFLTYMKQAEETILGKVATGAFSTGDMVCVMTLFQYVETFLRRFDSDLSEGLNLLEANQAFTLYGPTLGRLLSPGGELSKDDVYVFFTFLMKYGDTPNTMFGGDILYNHWKWHRDSWQLNADRTILMGILNQLSKF